MRVHDLDNGRSVDVTIVDRGPFAGPSRIIDLSTVAADALGIRTSASLTSASSGFKPQRRRIEVIPPPPLAGMRSRALASGSLTTAM